MPPRTFRFDLHLHSCLSPCAGLEMSPRVIVAEAQRHRLNALALTDHQSTLNCPAFAVCCAEAGIVPWFGMEMMTTEEVHVLALFDGLDAAMAFGDAYIQTLPRMPNRPGAYGDQIVVEADETVVGSEWRMLSLASGLDLPSAVQRARSAGALIVAAHVDRAVFSVPSQLGFLTGHEGFDAVELSVRAPETGPPDGLALAGYPVLRDSDAHMPWQVGQQWNEADLERFGVPEVRAALRAGVVRHGRPSAAEGARAWT